MAPGLARFAQGFYRGLEFALVRVRKSGIAGVGWLGEVDVVDDQAQRRNQCASVLDHQFESLVVHPRGVQDDIGAGARRGTHGLGAARMTDRLFT